VTKAFFDNVSRGDYTNEQEESSMKSKGKAKSKRFSKRYSVAIDTVPLPEKPQERIQFVIDQITPVISRIMTDAMTVAIGTWPTPEKPRKTKR
jgi:hypothetical protein